MEFDPATGAYAPLISTLSHILPTGSLTIGNALSSTALTNEGVLNLSGNAKWTSLDNKNSIVMNGAILSSDLFKNEPTASISGYGHLTGTISNDGTILAINNLGNSSPAGATIVVDAIVSGSGLFEIAAKPIFNGAGNTIEFKGHQSQAVKFDDAFGTLQLDDPGSYTGVITPYKSGDKLILAGFSIGAAHTYSGDSSGGTLTFLENGKTASLHFAGLLNDSSFIFSAGFQAVTTDPPSLVVTVAANMSPPDVHISSKGMVTSGPATLTGTVDADNADRVVTFKDGGAVIGQTTPFAGGTWLFSKVLAGQGLHEITAEVTSLAGVTGVSSPILFANDPAGIMHDFGDFTSSSNSTGGQVYALYDGLLGRAPDLLGLEFWADAFKDGVPPSNLAAGFLSSPEGQARAGALDNSTFVTQLYNATLHRAPDSGGLAFWTNDLNAGDSRANVGVGFALSAEHLANIQPALDLGLFVPDADAAAAARIYYTVLNRAPDAAGLQFWSNALKTGTPLTTETQSFLDTSEVQAKTGGLSTAQYVDAVYQNSLGRHADAAGLNFWTNAIDSHVATRADVTTQIGQSTEAQAHLAPLIEQGWHLA